MIRQKLSNNTVVTIFICRDDDLTSSCGYVSEIFIISDYRIDTTGIVNYYPVYDSTVTSATPPPIFSLIEKCGNDSLSIDILKEVTLQCNYTIIGTNIMLLLEK